MKSFVLLLAITPLFLFASDESSKGKQMWDGARVSKSGTAHIYTSAMHNKWGDIKSNYEENGVYYYSDVVNSFGFQEVLNVKQEMLFCGPSDRTFSDAIRGAMTHSTGQSSFGGEGVKYDATSIGFSAATMDSEIKKVLDNNSNPVAKGRFCYSPSDENVDYRSTGAEEAIYCDAGQSMIYNDSVSGYSCEIKLDINLKEGETRYLRQLQGVNPTIAQGFVGCYANSVSGQPELSLLDNPEGCSPANRESCIRTCDWAENVVCDPSDLGSGGGAIRWGSGNSCGAYGTVLFKGDVIEVEASPQLSYNSSNGVLYEGRAVVACADVGGAAGWVVTTSSCEATGN